MPNHEYLVFEQIPAAIYQDMEMRTKVPQMSNLITIVRAPDPEKAIQAVMSATGRIGRYAVVECEWTSFQVHKTTVTNDGVLEVQEEVKRLGNGNDEEA